MYRYGIREFLLEIFAVMIGLAIAMASVTVGFNVIGLRDLPMFIWTLSFVDIALIPFVYATTHMRKRSPIVRPHADAIREAWRLA